MGLKKLLSFPKSIFRVYSAWFLVSLLCLNVPLAAHSEEDQDYMDMSLEELLELTVPTVTTASTFEQKINKVPGPVTVITAQQIRDYGLRNLLDVFNIIPGFQTFVTTYASTDVRVRKYSDFYGTMKVMIDGRPVNEIYHRQLHCYEYFPLDNVKQIEVIRGPGSALYGTDAFCAVVNIITDKSERTTIGATGGEHAHYGANLARYDDVSEDFSYSLTLDYFEEDGDDLTFETDWLSGTGMSYAPNTRDASKKRLGFSASLEYKDFQLVLRHADNQREWWEGYVNIQSPEEEWVKSKLTYIDLRYLHHYSDKTSLRIRGMYDRNSINYVGQLFPPGFDWGVLYGVSDINGDGIDDNWPEGSFYDSKMDAQNFLFDVLYQTIYDKHHLSFGAEYGREQIDDVYTMTDFHNTFLVRIPYDTYTIDNPILGVPSVFMQGEGEKEPHYAVFLQDIFDLNDKLSIIAGARYDEYEDAGGSFSPRLAFIWNALTEHNLKLSYGKAFRAPGNNQKYNSAFGYFGNPDLEPQTIQTVDLTWQNLYEKRFHYAVGVYYSKSDDVIDLYINENPSFYNTGKVEFKGIEAEGKWYINKRFNIWGNYSHVTGENEVTGEDYNGAENLANLGFVATLVDGLKLSAFAHYCGEWERSASDPHTEPIDAWTTVHTALVYTGWSNLEISLVARNLLDEEYYSPNDIASVLEQPSQDLPNEGRQLLLTAKYKW